MNNKGFTLVELLASIVILAMILVIAIPGINNLSYQIRKKHLENTIKNIEVAASKYAFDTKEDLVFVDKLVEEGYLQSDEDDNAIYNEVNNQKLNCYLVKMEKVNNYYNATFQNDKSYEVDGKCDESKLADLDGKINIQIINNNEEVKDNEWLKGNAVLKAFSDNLNIDCEIGECKWTSNSGLYKEGLEVSINNIVGVLNTKYTFQYTKISEDGNINRYSNSIKLKIDNELPNIYIDETKKTITENVNKTLKIIASDNFGSGIVGYYLELDKGNNCENVEFIENNEFTINNNIINSRYLVCVKDKVGNIASEYIII